jgi:hypothetical protein
MFGGMDSWNNICQLRYKITKAGRPHATSLRISIVRSYSQTPRRRTLVFCGVHSWQLLQDYHHGFPPYLTRSSVYFNRHVYIILFQQATNSVEDHDGFFDSRQPAQLLTRKAMMENNKRHCPTK